MIERTYRIRRMYFLLMAGLFGIAFTTGTLLIVSVWHAAAIATVRYVAPGGDCGGASPCYSTVQSAVNEAEPGDEIRVAAGTYQGELTYNDRDSLSIQNVIIDKSITIQGGYTPANWTTPDPSTNRTILDAQHQGWVVNVAGNVTVELGGIQLVNGSGGIFIASPAHVLLRDSQVVNSSAENDGGVSNYGTLTMTNSDVLSSTINGIGGGIRNWSTGTINIYNATIQGNSAAYGGGIENDGGLINVYTSTIRYNSALGGYGNGGGILNLGKFTLVNSSILDNQAVLGGGIRNNGIMTITNTTISGNRDEFDAHGNGVANTAVTGYVTDLTILNSTIVSNTGSLGGTGAGIANFSFYTGVVTPTLKIKNTLVAFNSDINCSDPITSLGHNLEDGNSCSFSASGDQVNKNPGLDRLGYYNGPTLTYGLLFVSPAIDAGDSVGCPPTDQRGVPRPQGSACDIGAFETVLFRQYFPVIQRLSP